MIGSINASQIVAVTPSVLSAGGTAQDLIGLILTANSRLPIGVVQPFPTFQSVSAYFGPSATETAAAAVYFNGFDNSNKKPASVLFAQYPAAGASAWVRGAPLSGVSLAQLQAMTGSLAVTIDGVAKSAASAVVLTTATSFSAAAALIGTALGAAVTYDVVSNAFVVTSGTVGSASTITFPTGSLAGLLNLTQASGAILSPGAPIATPAGVMSSIVGLNRNWASFTTMFEPSLSDKEAFAAWNNAQGNSFLYVPWDTDVTATQSGNTSSFGVANTAAGTSGVSPVYSDPNVAFFMLGAIASIDFTELNGRTTLKFRGQAGLPPTIQDSLTALNLTANGYNFYGDYSTANAVFNLLSPGQVSGKYMWIDSYINQIWLTNQLQLAILVYMLSVKSIPYNQDGYAGIEASCLDPINQAVNFGAIRTGVTLSASEISQVNAAAGVKIDTVLSNRGWYLQILDAAPQVRAVRQSPPCTLWYMDGGSIQSINLSSIEVQ